MLGRGGRFIARSQRKVKIMVHAVNGTFALRGGGVAEDTSGLTGRGRHHKRYSDNATLCFCVIA